MVVLFLLLFLLLLPRFAFRFRFTKGARDRRDLRTVGFAANEARRRSRSSTATSKARSRAPDRSCTRKHLRSDRT
jgi:hypothetical protein